MSVQLSSQVVMSEGATSDTNVHDALTYRQKRRAQQALRNGIFFALSFPSFKVKCVCNK